jgi:hypothetical protein
MTKKKKKIHWKSEWISIKEQIPPEGILVLSYTGFDRPDENIKGNINQYCDGDWFHKTDKDVTWWRIFTPEDLMYYQDLSIKVFFEDLTDDKYNNWNLKQMYDIDFEKLRSWISNRLHE